MVLTSDDSAMNPHTNNESIWPITHFIPVSTIPPIPPLKEQDS